MHTPVTTLQNITIHTIAFSGASNWDKITGNKGGHITYGDPSGLRKIPCSRKLAAAEMYCQESEVMMSSHDITQ